MSHPIASHVIAAGPGLQWADPYAIGLVVLGLSLLAAVAALSHEHDRAFSASVIYLTLGMGAAAVIEVAGIRWLSPVDDAELLERLTELAVIFALFATGLQIDRPLGVRRWVSALRLIGLAMPLTIVAVTLTALFVMDVPLAVALLLGAALAPTDPVLAGDLGVGPPGEHDEREPNFAITAEAGLNDGLAFPFVLLAFVVARPSVAATTEWLAADVVYAVVAGVGIGAAAGWTLAAVILPLRARRLLRAELDGWLALACVLLLYGVTEFAGAYGFLAAFAGGLAFRRYERESEVVKGGVYVGADTASKFSELAVLLVLGSLVTLDGLGTPGLGGWLLCAALLLVIRPAAVLVSFVGSRLVLRERLFLAWFGVRGIGSLYYVAVALSSDLLAVAQETTVFWTVAVTILTSVVLHGITGTPATKRLIGEPSIPPSPTADALPHPTASASRARTPG